MHYLGTVFPDKMLTSDNDKCECATAHSHFYFVKGGEEMEYRDAMEEMLMMNGRKLRGRKKIFTSAKEITRSNILDVLAKAIAVHRQNVIEMQFLIDYERGDQPLQRKKNIRPDIDIQVISSLPNYIKEFKLGYNWSGNIALVQRGNAELHDTDAEKDDSGINALNEIMRNAEEVNAKDLRMAEFLEICGIGHKLVDIRSDYDDTESLFCDYDLDSRYAFCVYHNGVGQKKVLGVSFCIADDGATYYTCATDKEIFEIKDNKIINFVPNLLGKVNIIEFERSTDRTGCFERAITEIDALNIENADFANNVAQRTQEIWWGNNIEFPRDEQGNIVKPESGQWLLTFSNEGKEPKIQPMSDTFNEVSTLSSITARRKTILQDCKVPIQYENAGGGSTGVATDMSSGWSAAELDASKQQLLTERSKREELALIIKAISFVPENVLPLDSPIRKVHVSDVDFHFNRRKNYDMSIKANTFATFVSHGINGRHALKVIDAFEDTEQVWIDSKELIEKYQEKLFENQNTSDNGDGTDRIMSDNSDQISNSPILDGLHMKRHGEQA